MNSRIYNKVHTQAIELLRAAEKDDEHAFIRIYAELKALCHDNENDAHKNHPVQWETLADFTENTDVALEIYRKALGYAKAIETHDYIASISYSMAMLLSDNNQKEQALAFALQASESIPKVTDNELKREIKILVKTLETNS